MKKRKDAFLVKDVDGTFSVVMAIMPRRYDATNYTFLDIDCEPIDRYIAKKRADGEKYNYMHIMIAAVVRTFAMRPRLNRYTMNCRLYERYRVTVSFTIKQALKDDAEEITIKHTFIGNETIQEIRDTLENIIQSNIASAGKINASQRKANSIGGMPVFGAKLLVGTLRRLDRVNLMPQAFEKISPFHTSFFITNLKSIKTETVVHHCYDFGTTSIFIAMGKEKMKAMVDENHNVVAKKILTLGISADERICDGLYFGKSFHLAKRLLANPENLEEEYRDEKIEKELEKAGIEAKKRAIKQIKIDQKTAKKARKTAKKEEKTAKKFNEDRVSSAG